MRLTLYKELLYFVPNVLENIFIYILLAFSLAEMIRKHGYIFDRRS